MSTFTKLPSGKVLFESGTLTAAFSPNLNILPHPRHEHIIMITDDSNSQETDKGFLVDWRQVTSPNVTNKNDLIEQLAADFFFRNITGESGAAAWGGITGTLSEQTDLQAALNLKTTITDFYKKEVQPINDDFILDIAATKEVIIVDNSVKEITITLPLSNSAPNDGLMRNFFIYATSGNFPINIITSGSEAFPIGNNKHILLYPEEHIRVGVIYNQGWNKIGSIKTVLQIQRTASWARDNFINPTAVPFDQLNIRDNDSIFDYDNANPTKIIAKIKGRGEINYRYLLDSSGGSTYTCVGYVTKNGSQILGSETRTGNYGGEDQSDGAYNITVNFDPGDEFELVLDQNNMTGQLIYALMNIQAIL